LDAEERQAIRPASEEEWAVDEDEDEAVWTSGLWVTGLLAAEVTFSSRAAVVRSKELLSLRDDDEEGLAGAGVGGG